MAEAFWNAELEDEIRESNMLERATLKDALSREQLMKRLTIEGHSRYTCPHAVCSDEGNQQGIITGPVHGTYGRRDSSLVVRLHGSAKIRNYK